MSGVVKRMSTTAVLALTLVGCSTGSTSSPQATATPSLTGSVPAGLSGPCAAVKVTTPIDKAPAACAALWQPYDVTGVPPADLLSKVPAAPKVRNMTQNAVSDKTAQEWADASNRQSAWYGWAVANGQQPFLEHLASPTELVRSSDSSVLLDGARIVYPTCALYPDTITVAPTDADEIAFFEGINVTVKSKYTLVETFRGSCQINAIYPDGHKVMLSDRVDSITNFFPGTTRSDQLLGDLWMTEASGTCDSSIRQTWCVA